MVQYLGLPAPKRLSVLLALLYLICVAAGQQEGSGQCSFSGNGQTCNTDLHLAQREGTCNINDSPFDGSRWIVRFKSYLHAARHHAVLSKHLTGEGGAWRWVDRHNPAAAHPTDFGLLELSQQEQGVVLDQIRQLDGVRDLHPDKQFTGRLQGAPEVGRHPPAPNTRTANDRSDMAESTNKQEKRERTAFSSGQETPAEEQGLDLGVSKRPGRFSTSFMMDDENTEGDYLQTGHDRQLLTDRASYSAVSADGRPVDGTWHKVRHGRLVTPLLDIFQDGTTKRMLLGRSSITSKLGAEAIWAQGFSGAGVRVGVFDTGILPAHPHLRNIRERTNWTHQNSLSDGLGHGTFVAGVIGSQDKECPGLAPDVDLHTFKVFTDDQVSFTSWFLDAFNYAILSGINVINLSIGGPDFLDQPFVDKVWEVTSSGILLVSAIGNDGPLYGTLNNPADQSDVIGVGGIDDYDNISGFSSRGMTSWELTLGSGRVKPDVMAYSKDVQGSKIHGGCRSLSGTSVASPVVAGAVCLLASTVPLPQRWAVLNPASMKQALIEGADRLQNLNIYEQGAGRINLQKSMAILQGYQPRASVVPAQIDFTDGSYMWPYSRQGLYAGALPVIFNATVLNALGVTGRFEGPPEFFASDEGGSLLHLSFEYSEVLWPWSGFLALYMRVREAGRQFQGTATGKVVFTIVSPPAEGETVERSSTVVMPIKASIQPPPARDRRILWDQFHSIKYPPGYIPRDNLDIKHDILDWHGDHLFTNYNGLYNWLKDRDYYVEILSSPATCFNASEYGAYLLVDSEEEFYTEEVQKIANDVQVKGLNLIVFAEWYHVESMLQMRFYDDNTRSWWTPVTGGANVPALNDLLGPFGIALGDSIIHGQATVAGTRVHVSYGADIAMMPPGSFVHLAPLSSMSSKSTDGHYAFLGLTPTADQGGHVVVFSDSNCLDSSHQVAPCYEFLSKILDRVLKGDMNGIGSDANKVTQGWHKEKHVPPTRRVDINMSDYSFVLKNPLRCYNSSQCSHLASSTCSNFLDIRARTSRLTKTLPSSTNVAINYSGYVPGGYPTFTHSLPDFSNKTSFFFAKVARSASVGMSSTFLYFVSIVCVSGVMAVLVIWQCAGKGKARIERARR